MIFIDLFFNSIILFFPDVAAPAITLLPEDSVRNSFDVSIGAILRCSFVYIRLCVSVRVFIPVVYVPFYRNL